MKSKKIDFSILSMYLILTTLLVLYIRPNHIVGSVLYFFVPAFYLTLRHWKIYKHVAIFSWMFGLGGGFIAETISRANNLWTYEAFFPFFTFGRRPMEAIFWYVMYVWAVVAVYRVFIDRHRHTEKRGLFLKNHIIFITIFVSLFLIFFSLRFIGLENFAASYAYAKWGFLIVIAPISYALIRHPKLVPGILKASLALFILSLIYEIVGLHLGWWNYPGNFLATINIAGIALPLEEFIFWVVLGAVAVVAWYEEFENNLS